MEAPPSPATTSANPIPPGGKPEFDSRSHHLPAFTEQPFSALRDVEQPGDGRSPGCKSISISGNGLNDADINHVHPGSLNWQPWQEREPLFRPWVSPSKKPGRGTSH